MSFPKGLRTAILAVVLTVASLASIAAVTGGIYRTTTPGSSDPGLVVRTVGTTTVSGTVTSNTNTPDGGWVVKQINTAVPVTDNSGSLTVDGTVTTTQGNKGAQAWLVQPTTIGGAGATIATFRDLAATVQAVKGSGGTVYGVLVECDGCGVGYIQLFNLAAGSVMLGTTTPDIELRIPTTANYAAPIVIPFDSVGMDFTTAIAVACTTASKGSMGCAVGDHVTVLYR